MKKARVLYVLLAVLSLTNLRAAQAGFTGQYADDGAGHMFLTLVQTGNTVIGSLIVVRDNGKGGTYGDTMGLRGTANDDSIILVTDGLGKRFTGRKDGDHIILNFPTDAGLLNQARFRPDTEAAFNARVREWQLQLSAYHEKKEAEKAAADAEGDRLRGLSNALAEEVSLIRGTEIPKLIETINDMLDKEHVAIEHMVDHLTIAKENASVSPLSCYQVYTRLTYDVTVRLDYDLDTRFAYAQDNLTEAVNDLEDILARTNDVTNSIHEDAMELQSELKAARYPIPRLDATPDDALEAVKTYKNLATLARNDLPLLKAEDERNVDAAKDIMKDGEAVLRHAQTLVRCG